MGELDAQYTVDDVKDALPKTDQERFLSIMRHLDRIIEHPETLVGNEAAIVAAQLAAQRTIIGSLAQMYKTAENKSMAQRRRKDILLSMWTSLEENINTLKILGKIEAKIT